MLVGLWATAYDLIGISSPKTIVAGFSRVMYINVPVGEYLGFFDIIVFALISIMS